jgi:hypothetical protein
MTITLPRIGRADQEATWMQRNWQILLLVWIGSFMASLHAPVPSVAFPCLEETFDGASTTAAVDNGHAGCIPIGALA